MWGHSNMAPLPPWGSAVFPTVGRLSLGCSCAQGMGRWQHTGAQGRRALQLLREGPSLCRDLRPAIHAGSRAEVAGPQNTAGPLAWAWGLVGVW